MEFRCAECGHIGPAREVRPSDEGVQVVCADCGAASALDVDAEDEDEADAEQSAAPDRTEPSGAADTFEARPQRGEGDDVGERMRLSQEKALERLIPNQGEGPRCPKCAKLLPSGAEHCPRCGVDIEEARGYADGEAPWEQPSEGTEAAREQAELLWSAFREDEDPDKLERFVDFVEGEGLYEMGIRRLRFFLVDHRQAEPALDALRKLATGVQSRIATARAKAEVDAEELNKDIKNFKRKLIGAVLIVWALALVLFIQIFW